MKLTLIVSSFSLLLASLAFGQEVRPLEPTQNPNVPYRLFGSRNIYTFLRLDTRDGRVWQVQWGNTGERLTAPINVIPLVSAGTTGRFTLYPTTNIYTFLLLDQETGDAWQVQWGDADDRFVARIREPVSPEVPSEQKPEE